MAPQTTVIPHTCDKIDPGSPYSNFVQVGSCQLAGEPGIGGTNNHEQCTLSVLPLSVNTFHIWGDHNQKVKGVYYPGCEFMSPSTNWTFIPGYGSFGEN
jgi:hypothetical protein